jgi:3-methyladenine DNA glycosylase AlkD
MAIVLRNADRQQVVRQLEDLADPKWAEGAAHFGIRAKRILGVGVPQVRAIAKKIGINHALAAELWDTEIHEARLLASLVADPSKLTADEMENWARGFDSWAVCDAFCCNLFDRSPLAGVS